MKQDKYEDMFISCSYETGQIRGHVDIVQLWNFILQEREKLNLRSYKSGSNGNLTKLAFAERYTNLPKEISGMQNFFLK